MSPLVRAEVQQHGQYVRLGLGAARAQRLRVGEWRGGRQTGLGGAALQEGDQLRDDTVPHQLRRYTHANTCKHTRTNANINTHAQIQADVFCVSALMIKYVCMPVCVRERV